MHKYPKMLNLYKFDEATKGRRAEFSCPEFEYLQHNDWIWTEKIDGTNVRVIFNEEGLFEVRGRTDKAQLHKDLVANISQLFLPLIGEFTNMTFYGEGYGPGIQKGGHYAEEKSFILFDIFKHGEEGYYLPWADVDAVAAGRNIPRVPYYFTGSLILAWERVQRGLTSVLSNEDQFAEGLVGRPDAPIRGMRGERLIVKVKHRDYYGKELVK